MAVQTKRATVYLDPDIHKALRSRAIETSRSISDLVNEAIRKSLLEDAEDIDAFNERESEPLISFDEMVRKLHEDGRI